jgi:hypothetical protein
VRRAVLQRDGHRCQVPGCTNRLWLDIHHLAYRRDGGDHSEDNGYPPFCPPSTTSVSRSPFLSSISDLLISGVSGNT